MPGADLEKMVKVRVSPEVDFTPLIETLNEVCVQLVRSTSAFVAMKAEWEKFNEQQRDCDSVVRCDR